MENQKINPVVWFEIYVNDMDRAAEFYENVFQIILKDMGDPTDSGIAMKAFPSAEFNFGASGTLIKMKDVKAGGSGIIVYFGSEDCSVEESRVVNAGGKVCQSKISLEEYGFCTMITDTEGNTVGIHSMK